MSYQKIPALGQTTKSASLPVTVASDQDVLATSAKQDTIIGHVDGIETVLGTIDADTSNISTKIDTLAGAVAGTEMQVDVLTMPSVTVTATDLDIRNLAQATDGVAIYGSDDGGTTKRLIKTDAGGAIQVDLEVANVGITSIAAGDNNIGNVDIVSMPAITATDLDIRNLVNTDVVTAELSAVDNAVLDAIAASVAAIDTDTTTIIGHVDGIETAIGTTNTTLTTIDGRVDGLEASNSAIQTAVQLLDDTVQVLGTDVYTEATSKGITLGAVRRDADTTLVSLTNEFTPLQVDANGRLKVEAFSGETLPVSLTSTTITGTVAVTDNAGSLTVDAPVGTPAFVRLSDGAAAITTLPVSLATLPALVAGTANIGDVDVLTLPSIPAGTNNIGDVDVLTINGVAPAFNTGVRGSTVQRVTIATDDVVPASQSGTWTVQPGNTQNTTEWLVIDKATTSGGLSKSHLVSAASTNATNVKASAGQLYSVTAFNLNASPRYLKFHNTAGTPTAGTGVTDTFLIPGNTSGAGLVINFDKGIAFSTGIAFTLVTGIADANASAVAADEIVLNIYFK